MGVILIVGLLAFGIYYVIKTLGESETETVVPKEEISEKKESSSTSGSHKTDATLEEKKVHNRTLSKPYTEVYLFSSKEMVIRCAHCDGENPMGTKICRICGYETDI